MRERPILFSAPMVRAILAGTKTQTRRIAKDVRHPDLGNWYAPGALVLEREPQHVIERACPKGRPGDRLWVRETWARNQVTPLEHRPPGEFIYGADLNDSVLRRYATTWKPSIHMPRSACRLVLEINAIRLERLQAISEADAIAEGASFHDGRGVGHSGWRHDFGDVHATARDAFARLWRDINGPDSWSANPWVWVVEFMPADTDKKEM